MLVGRLFYSVLRVRGSASAAKFQYRGAVWFRGACPRRSGLAVPDYRADLSGIGVV